jgi:hypothetical protein
MPSIKGTWRASRCAPPTGTPREAAGRLIPFTTGRRSRLVTTKTLRDVKRPPCADCTQHAREAVTGGGDRRNRAVKQEPFVVGPWTPRPPSVPRRRLLGRPSCPAIQLSRAGWGHGWPAGRGLRASPEGPAIAARGPKSAERTGVRAPKSGRPRAHSLEGAQCPIIQPYRTRQSADGRCGMAHI